MKKILKKTVAAIAVSAVAISAGTFGVFAVGSVNPNYLGTYISRPGSYIDITGSNYTLQAVKRFDSGTKRFVNAANPTSYYIELYQSGSTGQN